MARRAGLLRTRLNERTLLSWARTNESLRTADSSSPVIAVMQPAHAPLANHCTIFQRACPASRRLLVQPQVRSVVVIIGNVLGEESLHVIALDERHLKRLLSQYVSYYHDDRTHLGLDKQTPAGRARSLENGTVICQRRVGGLHHRYDRAA